MLDLTMDISAIYGKTNVPFDERYASVIWLSNETVLYLNEVGQGLALVRLIRLESFKNQGLSDSSRRRLFTGSHRPLDDWIEVTQGSSICFGGPIDGGGGFLPSPPAPPNTVSQRDALECEMKYYSAIC